MNEWCVPGPGALQGRPQARLGYAETSSTTTTAPADGGRPDRRFRFEAEAAFSLNGKILRMTDPEEAERASGFLQLYLTR